MSDAGYDNEDDNSDVDDGVPLGLCHVNVIVIVMVIVTVDVIVIIVMLLLL